MSTPSWTAPQRVFFRFAFVYLGIYEFPLLVKRFLPGAWRNPIESLGALEPLVRAFGRTLGVHSALVMEHPIGGDTSFEWVRILFLLVLAAVATIAWSALDRDRRAYPILFDAFRTFVRYGLAFTMLNYAIVKPLQFTSPTLLKLLEPYGDASPMGLLWTFMGFSRPYTYFTGFVEAAGGVLLFWRRTTLLGAILIVAATTQVFLFNLFYDVPVKLYSAHLIGMALFLCAKDGGRLVRTLLALPARSATLGEEPSQPLLRIPGRAWVKWSAIAWTTGMTTYVLWGSYRPLPAPPPLYGVWRVESSDPPETSPGAWHHVVVDEWSGARVEHLDDSRVWYMLDLDRATAIFRPNDETKDARVTFRYSRPSEGELVLEGTVDGAPVTMHLRRREKPFLLVNRGFHWVQEGFVNQ